MKPNRKSHLTPVPAQVISLAAYRNVHRSAGSERVPKSIGAREVSAMDAYYQWLALVGAVWTFWW